MLPRVTPFTGERIVAWQIGPRREPGEIVSRYGVALGAISGTSILPVSFVLSLTNKLEALPHYHKRMFNIFAH
ncbi:MAG: hypothetical protein WDN00_16465 [Limisphaerales bacterium]